MYRVNHGLNAARTLKFYANNTRVSAFAPGIASIANSNLDNFNMKKMKSKGAGNDAPVTFYATQDIYAGSELLLNYGKKWHKRFDEKIKSATEYDTLEDYQSFLKKKKLPTEEDKRRKLAKMRRKLDTDDDDEFDDWEVSNDREHDNEEDDSEDEKVAKYGSQDEEDEETLGSKDSGERLEWLEDNGVCIDNLRAGPSGGAFSKRFIPKGGLIAPAPLMVLKRNDLVIYETDETQKAVRNVLNVDKIVGQERILNLCYGHPDSPVLLLPYSPIVSFINHDGEEPNAEIRWPDSADWLNLHPLDVLEMSGNLMMEFVALRDIVPGEEVFIDFGREWEDAMSKHKKNINHQDFRHEIGVPDGFFPDAWKHKSAVYELAPLKSPLQPGEVSQMTWAHNGKPICKNCYRVGLPSGFSQHMLEFSDERGITGLYEKLLYDDFLESDEWTVFDTQGREEWYAQRYMNREWCVFCSRGRLIRC